MTAYLDHNSGAPVRPAVAAAVALALAEPGNPSSAHGPGRRARARIEAARVLVAALVKADASAVIFTSGGTEANNLALKGAGRTRIIVSAIEHPSVREAVPGAEILPVDGLGRVDLARLEAMLAADDSPALVSVMLANNETGIVQPVAAVAALAHRFGALVHCDAAQAPGRLSVVLSDLNVDFLTLSAHKLGGPAGIGALVTSRPDAELAPILQGGGQERRRRAGSENVAGIVGFGVAAQEAAREMAEGAADRMRALRDLFEAEAKAIIPACVVVGERAERLCNTTCLALPNVAGQVQVMALDLAGVAISAGSACSSGKVAESPVLAAMGLGDLAGCAVRISTGPATGEDEIRLFLSAWADLAARKGHQVNHAAKAA